MIPKINILNLANLFSMGTSNLKKLIRLASKNENVDIKVFFSFFFVNLFPSKQSVKIQQDSEITYNESTSTKRIKLGSNGIYQVTIKEYKRY